ncbi:MAG: hypothetical protein AMK71_07980 [Nitrospira bacterium SG8_35_4]|nr:MAG: hypothetical protein AMK71_07980 [Nitrospira bacterium SG8_35_4]
MEKKIKYTALLLCVILGISCMFSFKNRQIIRIRDRETVSFETMMKDVTSASTVFIGERHDSPFHHKTQLDVIEALYEEGKPLAIGIEMFKKSNQHHLDAWISGDISEKEFIPLFLQNWGFGWNLYRDIFLYAREKGIPLIGLNVPREITKKVGQTGFQSLTDEELSNLPPGVTCELDGEYMDHLEMIFHYKKSSGRSFVYFCEAQVLWDQAMAWYLSEFIKSNPGRAVIVLAGAIHTWKYGIPKQTQRYLQGEQRVIVPDLPVGPESISEDDADYFVIHG